MKAIVIVALLALSFTTGFTCSKNQPEQTEATPAATEAAPAEGQPATEVAPEAAPAADAAATPAAETK